MIIKNKSGLEFTGFESQKELHQLVWECAENLPAFIDWKKNDRSKKGLIELGKRPNPTHPVYA